MMRVARYAYSKMTAFNVAHGATLGKSREQQTDDKKHMGFFFLFKLCIMKPANSLRLCLSRCTSKPMDLYTPRELVIQDQITVFFLYHSTAISWYRISLFLLGRQAESRAVARYVLEVRAWQTELQNAIFGSSDSDLD